MTQKETIEAKLLELLATIRPGATIQVNGSAQSFETDAGSLVTVEQEYTETPDSLPVISLFRGDHAIRHDLPGVSLSHDGHSPAMSIEGEILSDKRGTEGEQLRRDITRVIRSDEFAAVLLLPPDNIVGSSTVVLGEETIAQVKVNFNAYYRTPLGEE